jgi:stromal membrane-associated protein
MSRALPSTKKTHSEQHKQILKQLLKEEPNKTCVDCKLSKNPRWASWNLGCFLCIRCSGIHRSMGTHISKVKSVDLDAWTDEQIESMVKWGNQKCNNYWESKLPPSYVPDQSKLDNFIRTKYDMKKWVLSPQIPNPATLGSASNTSGATASAKTSDLSPTLQSATKHLNHQDHQKGSLGGNLLDDDDFGAFTSTPSSTPKPTPAPTQVSISQGAPIMANKPRLSSHDSSPILTSSSINSTKNTPQSAQSTGGSLGGRPDLKKSILSLYSSPSSSNQFLPQRPVQQYQQATQPQKQPQQQQQAYDLNSLSSSLSGLDFNSTSSTSSKPTYNQPSYNTPSFKSNSTPSINSIQKPAQTNWNNEWSDSSSNSNNWTSSAPSKVNNSGLDDELFKNVWN